MAEQRLHPNLNALDLLTNDELKSSMGHAVDTQIREMYRGMKVIKLPQIRLAGNGGALDLTGQSMGAHCGPDSGYIWVLGRIMVASNTLTDSANYILYSGSDPTLFDSFHILDGLLGPVAAVAATPAVPASAVAQQNPNAQPVQVVVTAGTVTAVTVNGVQVGSGDGTYFVPAYGSISVTYSAAPTWVWTGTAPPLGRNVNVAYYPGTRAAWLFPGEQVYAQVNNSVASNIYALTGLALECPAEMQGKLF